jgi:hypothetical protein
MDHEELLNLQFSCCKAFVSSSSMFLASTSPGQWLRLQALDLQATSGPCTLNPPSFSDTEGRAVWYALISPSEFKEWVL